MQDIYFERAIFFSWFCSLGDCKFCYMSTQKNLIKDPTKAKRTKESILAEAFLAKALNWKIEFLSGGYHSYSMDELVELTKNIYEITEQKQWLNIGTLNKEQLKKFIPYIEGVAGTIECINGKIRKKVCPSKPIEPILEMFKACDELGLKKAITIIIGIGESIDDFESLKDFISKYKIDRITFYSLNPQKGTIFTKPPDKGYYAEWIRKTREAFPKLHIIAGLWHDKTEQIPLILEAGADNLTKFPALKYFGKKEAKDFEEKVKMTNRKLKSTFTIIPEIDWKKEIDKYDFDQQLKIRILEKINSYLSKMRKNL